MRVEGMERSEMNASRRQSATSGRRVIAIDREAQALQLRASGISYREIAVALDISLGAAHRVVQRGLERLVALSREEAEQLRRLELERLDGLVRGHYQRAVDGDVASAGVVLRTISERARLLGLYAPASVDVSGVVAVDRAQEVLGRLRAEGLA
jgi:DNA-binding CsgD family transcriptional regulator